MLDCGISSAPRHPLCLLEIGNDEIVEHPSDDDLEGYAMRPLPASEKATLDGHLLICPECRNRLDAEIELVTAMRSEAAKIREIGMVM